jgi:MgsA AAA+ ATPase C terminal
MQEANLEAKIDELLGYPEHCFGEPAPDRWLDLCSSLTNYQACSVNFAIEKDRKWELVSALQKAIRRADKVTALQLLAGIASMPEDYSYFWRRICVVAAEDVGPADDTLVKFVIACAKVFSPRELGTENRRHLCFFVEQMCDLPTRSRIYCSFESVSIAAKNATLPALCPDDKVILEAIAYQKDGVKAATTRIQEWQKRQDWRTAGLLKYLGLRLPLASRIDTRPLPASRTIFDLPTYCYDQYTRIGLTVLHRLVQGVRGAGAIRDFFQRNRVKEAHKVLGEALFTVEGGRENCELIYPALRSLEQRIFAHQFGLPFDDWLRLCDLTLAALRHGIIDVLREEIVRRQYGQKNLQLVCQ